MKNRYAVNLDRNAHGTARGPRDSYIEKGNLYKMADVIEPTGLMPGTMLKVVKTIIDYDGTRVRGTEEYKAKLLAEYPLYLLLRTKNYNMTVSKVDLLIGTYCLETA